MAITTSPDNIPSPTSGDPYNYVVDMAALADGTQDALTQKANMGVGTSTQRTAALSKFPDGALWYDTTTSSEWRRVAGAWVDDSQWVDYSPILTNITVGNGTLTAKHRKNGLTREVVFKLTLGSTSAIGDGPRVEPPTTPLYGGVRSILVLDSGAAYIPASALIIQGSQPMRLYTNAGVSFSATVPMTWTVFDELEMSLSYFED